MHFSTAITALTATLLATAAVADPVANLLPRNTDGCSSSLSKLDKSRPTATDKSLSSFLAQQPSTTTFSVPVALQPAYCTFDRSLASWAKSSAVPFISKCSDFIGDSSAKEFSSAIKLVTTTESWCGSVTGKNAAARETGFIAPGMLAAAGLVAAVL